MPLYVKEKIAGRTIGFRCLLEGVEVPVSGGSVREMRNSHSTATLNLPPAPAILSIRPRTHLGIFYRINNGDWELLFEGETTGRQLMKDAVAGQFARISAISLSSHLIHANRNHIDKVQPPGMQADKFQDFFGDGITQFTNDPDGNQDFSSKILQALTKEGPGGGPAGCLMEIIRLVYSGDRTSPWHKFLEKRYGMTKRFLAIFPDLMESFVTRNDVVKLFKNEILGTASGETSIWRIINDIMNMTWVEYVENNRITQGPKFMFKPNLYWTVPPRCNSIFPEQYGSLVFGINEMEECTRLHITTNGQMAYKDFEGDIGLVEYNNYMATAPKDLAMDQDYRSKQKSDKHMVMTFEEMERGMIPISIPLSSSHAAAIGAYLARDPHITERREKNASDATKKRDDYMHKYAQAQYFFHRYSSRDIPVHKMIFSPQLHVGYSGCIYTDCGYIIGDMSVVEHTFDASSGVQSSCVMERGRFVNEIAPEVPVWMRSGSGQNFRPLAIHDFYKKFLGCSSIIDLNLEYKDESGVKRKIDIDFGAFGGDKLSESEKKGLLGILSRASTFDEYIPKEIIEELKTKGIIDGQERWDNSQLIYAVMEQVYRQKYMPNDDKHRFILEYTARTTHSEESLYKEVMGCTPSIDPEELKKIITGSVSERPQQIWSGGKMDNFKAQIIRTYIKQLPIGWDRGPEQGPTVNEFQVIDAKSQKELFGSADAYLTNKIFNTRTNTRERDQIQDSSAKRWGAGKVKQFFGGRFEVPMPKPGTLGLHPLFEKRVDKLAKIYRHRTGQEIVMSTRHMSVSQQRQNLVFLANTNRKRSGNLIPLDQIGRSLFQYGFAVHVDIPSGELSGDINYNLVPNNQRNPYYILGEIAKEIGLGWGGEFDSPDVNYIYEVKLPTGEEIKRIYIEHLDRIYEETGIRDLLGAYDSLCSQMGRKTQASGFLMNPLI